MSSEIISLPVETRGIVVADALESIVNAAMGRAANTRAQAKDLLSIWWWSMVWGAVTGVDRQIDPYIVRGFRLSLATGRAVPQVNLVPHTRSGYRR